MVRQLSLLLALFSVLLHNAAVAYNIYSCDGGSLSCFSVQKRLNLNAAQLKNLPPHLEQYVVGSTAILPPIEREQLTSLLKWLESCLINQTYSQEVAQRVYSSGPFKVHPVVIDVNEKVFVGQAVKGSASPIFSQKGNDLFWTSLIQIQLPLKIRHGQTKNKVTVGATLNVNVSCDVNSDCVKDAVKNHDCSFLNVKVTDGLEHTVDSAKAEIQEMLPNALKALHCNVFVFPMVSSILQKGKILAEQAYPEIKMNILTT